MKTTVDIADPLFRQAKEAAEKDGATMRQFIEDGLRIVLETRQAARRKRFRLGKLPTQGGGLRPVFADAKWDKLLDASYHGHGA